MSKEGTLKTSVSGNSTVQREAEERREDMAVSKHYKYMVAEPLCAVIGGINKGILHVRR